MRRIGIDIGGTFTDLVFWDDESQRRVIHKRASTPDDPARAGMEGVNELCSKAGICLADIDLILHGTTVATNILLERSGAKVGLITNAGFRDILHIGRKNRPCNFAHNQLLTRQHHPLVARQYRVGVAGRIEAPSGAEIEALDVAAVERTVRNWREGGEVTAIAVCCLHAYLNPTHEQQIVGVINSLWPEVFVSASHDIVPLYREYERMSTTALNAYVGPGTSCYLQRFSQSLADAGYGAELCLMTSAGGVVGVEEAGRRPVSLLLSGPVGALIAGVQAGTENDIHHVITLDVGGTSADIGVAPAGQVRMRSLLDTQIGGYDAMVPMCDIDTIGAGGGSIAWIDEGGAFRVGPQSAGADPGPACYNRGGTQPTVTDALVVLGWYRTQALRNSGLHIEPALAADAIEQHIAKPLGLTVYQAAAGIYQLAVHSMVESVRVNSVARGLDPREFALVAYGGAGAAFAVAVAHELSMPQVIVPPAAGVGAAGGLLATDMKYTRQATLWQPLASADQQRIQQLAEELTATAVAPLHKDGFDPDAISISYNADCRYIGQGYELQVTVPTNVCDPNWCQRVAKEFHAAHQQAHHRAFPDSPVMLVNLGVTATGRIRVPTSARLSTPIECSPAHEQPARFSVAGQLDCVPTRFLARSQLAPGACVNGPVVIEQDDTTTVVPPGCSVTVHPLGHLQIVLQPGVTHVA